MAPGGTIPSESPVHRVKGMSAGVVPECPFPLRLVPVSVTIDTVDQFLSYDLVGGAGALADDSDDTYLRYIYNQPGTPPSYNPYPYFTFGAVDLPAGAVITGATLWARVRASASGSYLSYAVAGDLWDTYSPLYTEATGATWLPSTSGFSNKIGLASWLELPSVAAIEAGAVQGQISPYSGFTDGRTVDIAEVWIVVEGTCP